MKILFTIGIALATIVGVALALWHYMPGLQAQFLPPKMISVTIRLDNRCSVDDRVFVAYAPAQRRTARFIKKTAIMRLPENAKIQLAIANGYPDFNYDDVAQDVASTVVLVADCEVSPRLRSIFGSMNEKFKK
jgi:hypothetical protein